MRCNIVCVKPHLFGKCDPPGLHVVGVFTHEHQDVALLRVLATKLASQRNAGHQPHSNRGLAVPGWRR